MKNTSKRLNVECRGCGWRGKCAPGKLFQRPECGSAAAFQPPPGASETAR